MERERERRGQGTTWLFQRERQEKPMALQPV